MNTYHYICGVFGLSSSGWTKDSSRWLAFDQYDVDRMTANRVKPYGSGKRTGCFRKAEGNK